MSYDISLCDAVTGEELELDEPHQMKGGTYALGGSTSAHLNITWNYGDRFRRVFGDEGIRTIYGTSGAESIPVLKEAAGKLGDEVDPDYWKSTDGNAKKAILQLIALATLRPDGVWRGD